MLLQLQKPFVFMSLLMLVLTTAAFYYISYNFNVQGADMSNLIDIPVYDLLNGNISNTTNLIKDNSFDVSIYPNPATQYLQIKSTKQLDKYWIYDLSSKLVKTEVINSINATLNLSQYQKGLYFIHLQSKHQIKTLKFFVK